MKQIFLFGLVLASIMATTATRAWAEDEEVMSAPDSDGVAAQSVLGPERDYRVPLFQQVLPEWGIDLAGSFQALGGNDLIAEQGGSSTRGVSLRFDYQPRFAQSVGVFGIGPTISMYPIDFGANVTTSLVSIYSFGGRLQYQARFFREQPLVPVVGFAVEDVNYSFTDGIEGSVFTQGPVFGVYFLLNSIDSAGAADFYVNTGILRSYLVAELRSLSGDSSDVSISGQSFYFGVRIEL